MYVSVFITVHMTDNMYVCMYVERERERRERESMCV